MKENNKNNMELPLGDPASTNETTKFGRSKGAVKKANEKYLQNYEMISFRVKKGDKELIKKHAALMQESLNQFLQRAVMNQIENDLK